MIDRPQGATGNPNSLAAARVARQARLFTAETPRRREVG
jgi:hypothetical protein